MFDIKLAIIMEPSTAVRNPKDNFFLKENLTNYSPQIYNPTHKWYEYIPVLLDYPQFSA